MELGQETDALLHPSCRKGKLTMPGSPEKEATPGKLNQRWRGH